MESELYLHLQGERCFSILLIRTLPKASAAKSAQIRLLYGVIMIN